MLLSFIAGEGKQSAAVRYITNVSAGVRQDKMVGNVVISSVLGCAVEKLCVGCGVCVCVWALRMRQLDRTLQQCQSVHHSTDFCFQY